MFPSAPQLLLAALLGAAPPATPVAGCAPAPEARWGLERVELQRVARAERRLALRELWPAADAPRREAALVRLAPRAGRPVRAGLWPDIEALVDAERILRGGPGPTEPGGWEQRLADSLNLVAVPGAFAAGDDTRRQPLTVYVLPHFSTPVPEAVHLRLLWISPEGQESSARTEPIEPAHFAGGFEMYLQAPPSRPAEWSLVPIVLRGDGAYRGLPVAIDAVVDLDRRRAALPATEASGSRRPGWGRVLAARDLLEGGLRSAALTAEDCLRLAEGEPAGRLPGGLVPAEPRFEAGELSAWRLGQPGAAWGVLLVAGPQERPEELLAGALGERWEDAARRGDFEVFATGLPLLPDPGLRSALDLFEALRAERGWAGSVLVALGDAAQPSAAALRAWGGGDPDHLVLVREAPGAARPDPRLDLPVLSVEPLAAGPGDEDLRPEGPPWRRVRLREPRFLAELELPGLVAGLLGEPGAGPGGGSRGAGGSGGR